MALRQPPAPLNIPWTCKPVDSARSGVDILDDGRVYCWIEHQLIRGVTPKMLVWWFKNVDGDMIYDGRRLPRYRVWHPRDHVSIEFSRRNPDGSTGVGSVIHITEILGGNPNYLVDVHTEVVKLETDEGTLYYNSLTVGARGVLGHIINPLLRRFAFDESHGHAWVKHNIEEVGNFESFLSELYAEAHETPLVACEV
jgi:DAPG hydrolase PhiG domain